jgi:hypothetical protein
LGQHCTNTHARHDRQRGADGERSIAHLGIAPLAGADDASVSASALVGPIPGQYIIVFKEEVQEVPGLWCVDGYAPGYQIKSDRLGGGGYLQRHLHCFPRSGRGGRSAQAGLREPEFDVDHQHDQELGHTGGRQAQPTGTPNLLLFKGAL